ncbi:selenoprotein K [Protopterus annectens]|uniref:selenoprotein K n=1 Tax=Protopterus annectens TaxID=7888 RepID=UPI001CFC14F3|nr:selenoprotein K [Protopterus annectens]
MVYVSNGQMLDSRRQSPWRLSFITDFFWGIVDFVALFFQTLINPDMSRGGSQTSSRYTDDRGPPRFPRRMGRINHGGGGPSPPPMGGGG